MKSVCNLVLGAITAVLLVGCQKPLEGLSAKEIQANRQPKEDLVAVQTDKMEWEIRDQKSNMVAKTGFNNFDRSKAKDLIYPESTPLQQGKADTRHEEDGTVYYNLFFTSADKPDKIAEFYKKKLADAKVSTYDHFSTVSGKLNPTQSVAIHISWDEKKKLSDLTIGIEEVARGTKKKPQTDTGNPADPNEKAEPFIRG